MVQDPYSVIGVSQGASPDEIKKAYRKKAKLYHPDLHPNDAAAAKKMAELNEAYDMLMNPDKYAGRRAEEEAARNAGRGSYGSYGGYSGYGGYGGQSGSGQGDGRRYYYDYDSSDGGGFYGFDFNDLFGGGARTRYVRQPEAKPGDSQEIRDVIQMIRDGRFTTAIDAMTRITSDRRDARWYYLYAYASLKAGNTVAAFENAQRAVDLEGTNEDYRLLLQYLQQQNQSYEQNGSWFNMNVNPTYLCCLGLCAANLFANMCCGGLGRYPFFF